ncbi:aldo/keto reductase [Nitzschia inconspicua]|uniref:Aldo/keto reductase n=1 Tax=Nitzschia inconspicua TaxID=303405 RepID=A0A9K3PWM7_9STRA|nr:aldo/keto reductase [Nitzschia inconspicua]KAG7362413.1 aldo/keto reductase [Nitzschia inconspicua]
MVVIKARIKLITILRLVLLWFLIVVGSTTHNNSLVSVSALNNNLIFPTTTRNPLSSLLSSFSFSSSSSNQQPNVGRVSAGPLQISSLGIGTWSWGNRFLFDYDTSQDDDLYSAYRELRQAGVTLFDTADSYGTLDLNGRAEQLLGIFERRYRTERGIIDDNTKNNDNQKDTDGGGGGVVPKPSLMTMLLSSSSSSSSSSTLSPSKYLPQQVATKLAPYPWRVTPSQIVNAAKGSLRRLEQPKLAIAQLHWSTANYQPFQERALWEGICDVYDQGLCDAIGVSNYGPQQLQKLCTYLENERPTPVPLAIAQIQYSLMTYGQDVTQDMDDVCNNVNCRLVAYSPLCLGLLTGKYTLDKLPTSTARRQLFRELLPGATPLLNTLNVIAKEYGKTQSQVAINWCICKGTVPIPGARNAVQAKENLGATGWSLKPDAVRALDDAAKQVSKPMIQNIFQTK